MELICLLHFCVIKCQICDASLLFGHAQANQTLALEMKLKKEQISVALDIFKKGKTKCIHQIFHVWTSIVSDFFPLRKANVISFGKILKDGKKLYTIL